MIRIVRVVVLFKASQICIQLWLLEAFVIELVLWLAYWFLSTQSRMGLLRAGRSPWLLRQDVKLIHWDPLGLGQLLVRKAGHAVGNKLFDRAFLFQDLWLELWAELCWTQNFAMGSILIGVLRWTCHWWSCGLFSEWWLPHVSKLFGSLSLFAVVPSECELNRNHLLDDWLHLKFFLDRKRRFFPLFLDARVDLHWLVIVSFRLLSLVQDIFRRDYFSRCFLLPLDLLRRCASPCPDHTALGSDYLGSVLVRWLDWRISFSSFLLCDLSLDLTRDTFPFLFDRAHSNQASLPVWGIFDRLLQLPMARRDVFNFNANPFIEFTKALCSCFNRLLRPVPSKRGSRFCRLPPRRQSFLQSARICRVERSLLWWNGL